MPMVKADYFENSKITLAVQWGVHWQWQSMVTTPVGVSRGQSALKN